MGIRASKVFFCAKTQHRWNPCMHYLASYPGQVHQGNEPVLAGPARFAQLFLGNRKAVWGHLCEASD